MLLRAIVIVAGLASLDAPAAPASSSASPAVQFSELAGPILGIAASCRGISDARLDGAADAVLDAIERLSRDRRDVAAANERLRQGIAAGARGDCARAAAILGALLQWLPQRSRDKGPLPSLDSV